MTENDQQNSPGNITTDPVNILKEAILLEQRGQTYYRAAAGHARNKNTKRIFELMEQEEKEHEAALTKQLQAMLSNKPIPGVETPPPEESAVHKVLNGEIRREISAADIEAAAISVAIAMEEKAVRFYQQAVQSAVKEENIALYKQLEKWEQQHLDELVDFDEELKGRIWEDQRFWPLY